MFTGLIREVATVKSFVGSTLTIQAKHKANIGDSIAVNGACLTVVKLFTDGFAVELSPESQKLLAIENYKNRVHIEPAMKMGERFEGHIVQGHIDTIGTIRAIQNNWNNVENLVSCTKQPSALQDLYDAKAKEKGLIKGDYMLYMDIGTYSCYASRENSLIIYPDMSIRKCTVALDDERNKVGFINDKAKLVKNSNWNLWTLNKHSIHNKQECQTCSFNPQCLSSACPLKFIDTGEIICPHEVYNLENLSNNIIDYIENK